MLFSLIFKVFEICTPLLFNHPREPVHKKEFLDSLLAVSGAESGCYDKNKIYVNSVAVERNSKVFGNKHLLSPLVHTLLVLKALLTKICIKLWQHSLRLDVFPQRSFELYWCADTFVMLSIKFTVVPLQDSGNVISLRAHCLTLELTMERHLPQRLMRSHLTTGVCWVVVGCSCLLRQDVCKLAC